MTKKRINSRDKGIRAELYVANSLTAWYGEKFKRKSIGQENSDLQTPDGFPFAVEVKDNSQIKFIHFAKPTKLLRDFWKQAQDQARDEKRLPVLIAKVESKWYAIERDKRQMEGITADWTTERVNIQPFKEWMAGYTEWMRRIKESRENASKE